MKIAVAVLGFLILSVASLARADITVERCVCSTEAQWTARAASFGAGYVGYLYNFDSAQIRKYRNAGMINGGGSAISGDGGQETQGGGGSGVTWLPVEARYQEQFNDLLVVRSYFARPLSAISIEFNLPQDAVNQRGIQVGDYNAYSIMNSPGAEMNLRDYLLEQRRSIFNSVNRSIPEGVVDTLVRVLQTIDRVRTKGEYLKITIKVIFKDGSRAAFVDDGDGRPTRKPGATVDRNGNPIPETPAAGRGEYDIHADDYEAWFRYMQSMGVQFTRESGTIHCAWDGETLRCRVPTLAN